MTVQRRSRKGKATAEISSPASPEPASLSATAAVKSGSGAAASSFLSTPERDANAMAICRARGLSVMRTEEGKWRAYSERGQAQTTAAYADPVEALEAAESAILAGEKRAEETRAGRLLEALAGGQYSLWPKPLNGTIEWQVITVPGRDVLSKWSGLKPALVEIGRLTGTTES